MLAAGVALVGVTVTPLAIPSVTRPIRANLDADPQVEVVIPEAVQQGDQTLRRVVIEDDCNGKKVRHRISGLGTSVDVLRVVDVDRARPAEVFFVLRVDSKGRLGGGRVIRFQPEFAGECSKPQALFVYRTQHPPIKPPRNSQIVKFSITLGNFASRFRGQEIRVQEYYVGLRKLLCCPAARRTTFSRWSTEQARYVRYKTKLERVRPRR